MAKNDEPKGEGEAAVVEAADGPLARSHRRRRQAADQDRQEARLGHPGRAERRPAVGRDFLRPDRGHERDAQRDGHQRRRQRGRGGGGEGTAPRPPTRRRAEGGESRRDRRARPRSPPAASEPAERTDDPVRMYLREMGSVELLSREGEIAIAKRIEAGREAMIAGLCESPLTFQAIIIWRDELNEAKILLRDIIDLEATYAGPDGKKHAEGRHDRARRRRAPPPNPRARARSRPRPRRAAPPAGFDGEGEPRRRPKASTTRTISRIPSRCRRWRPSSSRRCSRPSTASPTPTRSCAACRTRTSRTSSRTRRCRRPRSASTRR